MKRESTIVIGEAHVSNYLAIYLEFESKIVNILRKTLDLASLIKIDENDLSSWNLEGILREYYRKVLPLLAGFSYLLGYTEKSLKTLENLISEYERTLEKLRELKEELKNHRYLLVLEGVRGAWEIAKEKSKGKRLFRKALPGVIQDILGLLERCKDCVQDLLEFLKDAEKRINTSQQKTFVELLESPWEILYKVIRDIEKRIENAIPDQYKLSQIFSEIVEIYSELLNNAVEVVYLDEKGLSGYLYYLHTIVNERYGHGFLSRVISYVRSLSYLFNILGIRTKKKNTSIVCVIGKRHAEHLRSLQPLLKSFKVII